MAEWICNPHKRMQNFCKLVRLMRNSIAEQTAFVLDLSKRVALTKDASVKNLAFSPISVNPIFNLMAAGSKGRVLDQTLATARQLGAPHLRCLSTRIVDLLFLDGSQWENPRISFAHGVWIDSSLSLKPSFHEIATQIYKAQAKTLTFETKPEDARQEINSWAENATAGLITNVLPPGSIHERTRMVLGNALYFKGTWAEKFCESEAKESKFYLLDGSTSTQVSFMTTKENQLISAYNGFKVLSLPYKRGHEDRFQPMNCRYVNEEYDVGRKFSMYVFLPDKRDGLWGLWERLCSEPHFLDRYPAELARVGKFKFPKFKVEFGLEVSEILQDMGLVLPFEGGALTGMASSPISVSSIFHKSVVELTEEGTEAAAADTAKSREMVYEFMNFEFRPPLPPIVDFEADHPFIYLIRENLSGAVIFVGHVLDPSMVDDE